MLTNNVVNFEQLAPDLFLANLVGIGPGAVSPEFLWSLVCSLTPSDETLNRSVITIFSGQTADKEARDYSVSKLDHHHRLPGYKPNRHFPMTRLICSFGNQYEKSR